MRFIRQLHGTSAAPEFGPMALKDVGQAMIDAGRSRKLINQDVNRIRQMIGRAVEDELLPVAVARALREVKGLRRGRSAARETAPVEPVAEEHVRAILPLLSPQVATRVRLQHLCGARPQEVIAIRPCEIVTGGDVWLYQPRHKTEHLDRSQVIMLGPMAQDLMRPLLDRDPESYCFVPAEVAAWHRDRSRRSQVALIADRKTRAGLPRRAPGPRYMRHSYRVAIQRACRRAGIPVWSPHQLRHARATTVRRVYGLEAAKAVLGHMDRKTGTSWPSMTNRLYPKQPRRERGWWPFAKKRETSR